ncbi:MAG: large conductance mechanosensitive channel protein MscL [Clostridia bacterium]|nr:large conductance mechanosensitive channel protein MscL [Clostridia bacterium]
MAKSTFWKEFKEFITKGNVVDMAVGVVVGGAFKSIVSSLVADIITPCISLLTGKSSFNELTYVLKEGSEAVLAEDGTVIAEAVAPTTINYGLFIQYIIDFIIISLAIFVVLKVFTSLQKRSAELRQKLDAEAYEAEQKKIAEEAAAKAAEEAKAAEAAAAEKADIEAARAAQRETAALLADIKELLANK